MLGRRAGVRAGLPLALALAALLVGAPLALLSFAAPSVFAHESATPNQDTVGPTQVLSHGAGLRDGRVVGGAIPTPKYTVTFTTSPASCGPVLFNGTSYANGTSGKYSSGTYSLSASPCAGHAFRQWNTSGLVSVVGHTSSTTTAGVAGNGSLEAWYVPSAGGKTHFTVGFQVAPASCGPIQFNGSGQLNGSSGSFPAGNYSTTAPTCPGYSFLQWSTAGGVATYPSTASSAVATISGNGTLSAKYASTAYAVNFFVSPSSCGPISFNGSPKTNGSSGSYAAGTYSTVAASCTGYNFHGWSANGGLTLGSPSSPSTNTTVSAAGNLTADYVRGTGAGGGSYVVTFTVNPTYCGPITFNGTSQASGTTSSFPPGTYPAVAHACAGYTFSGWSSTGGVALATPTSASTTVTVSSPGALTATYVQNAPGSAGHRYNVSFVVIPSACGGMGFNGTTQANGSWGMFRPGNYSALAPACTGRAFHGWSGSGGVQPLAALVNPTTVSVQGNGTLTATYWTNGSAGTSSAGPNSLSNGLAIGLTLVVVGAVAVLGVLLYRRRKARSSGAPAPPPPPSTEPPATSPPPDGQASPPPGG